LALQQSQEPGRRRLAADPGNADHGGGADDQQLPQPFVAGFADLAEAVLAACGMFLWCQPKPGGEMSSRFEVGWVDRERHGDCGDRSDPGNLREHPAERMSLMLFEQLPAQSCDLAFQLGYMAAHLDEHIPLDRGNGSVCIE